MSKFLMIVGIFQMVSGLVIGGLVAKDIYDSWNEPGETETDRANSLGPVVIAALIITNGVCGVCTVLCVLNDRMKVVYLIGATVAATASAALVWIFAILLYNCHEQDFAVTDVYPCPGETLSPSTTISVLAFSALSCTSSMVGMIVSSLIICSRMSQLVITK